MKLDAVVAAAVAGGFIAADKAPDLTKAILAADKRAKDSPENTGMGPRNLQHTQDRAKDEAEEAEDAMAEACDSRAAAADESEEEADKGKADDKAKDRKAARDARKGARDARKGARDARKGARDKRAKDRNDDPEGTNPGAGDAETQITSADPNPPGGPREKGKTAVDSAEVDRRISAAVAARDALHVARTEVAPIIGVTAYDTAGDTYRKALDKLGVDTVGLPDSALRAMLTLAKERASAVTASAPAALDAATAKAVNAAIPGINRLRK